MKSTQLKCLAASALLILCLLAPPARADITTGLVGWWRFDEGTGTSAIDSSIYGNTGTLTNGPVWVNSCARGKCLTFDGTDDYVETGVFGLPAGTADRSISAWIKVNSYAAWQGIYGYGKASPGNGFYFGFDDKGKLMIGKYGENSPSSSIGIPQNMWFFVAVVYSVNTLSFYVNNLDAWIVPFNGVNTIVEQSRIGRSMRGWDGVDGNYTFNGMIDDVRIYNRALSAADVQELYHWGQTRIGNARISNAIIR